MFAADVSLWTGCRLGSSVISALAGPQRRLAVSELLSCEHVDMLTSRVSQSAIWRRYAQYPFVVTTRGNGLDCHRTWELIYLGCIVITKTSSLDPLYSELPVDLVDDWNAVRETANLAYWLRTYGELTECAYVWERLNPTRYLQPIREAVQVAERA